MSHIYNITYVFEGQHILESTILYIAHTLMFINMHAFGMSHELIVIVMY